MGASNDTKNKVVDQMVFELHLQSHSILITLRIFWGKIGRENPKIALTLKAILGKILQENLNVF